MKNLSEFSEVSIINKINLVESKEGQRPEKFTNIRNAKRYSFGKVGSMIFKQLTVSSMAKCQKEGFRLAWRDLCSLGIYPKECDSDYSKGTAIFIAALFTIAKLWKQPRCPTTDEWIKKIWYLYTMEFY
jgi:hypothetical protein